MTDNRRENTQWTDKKCWDISLTTPLFIQKGRRDGTRKGPSSFENMPFLHVEEALLGARRACSSTLFVTLWLLDGYKLDYRRDYTPVLRAFNALLCNDFSQPYRALYCVKRLPNYTYKHTKKHKKVRPFTCIITLKNILSPYAQRPH